MWEVLIKVIPLNLAATLSPGLLAATLFLLGSKLKPKGQALALLLGALLVGVLVVMLGIFLGNPHPESHTEKMVAAIINIVLGAAFLVFAIRGLVSKEKKIKFKTGDKPKYLALFLIGIAVNATNFDAVFLSLTAAKEATDSPDISDLAKMFFYCLNVFFFTLPIWLPIGFFLVAPKVAAPLLSKLNKIVIKYSKYIISIIFLIMGIWLLYSGIKFLI
ncbi:GAP family protein [Patescibacteria group bacterium]|nr:GAP family protein [Patescibacteria group bacterium]MBU1673296.1 GAP family protein [Patescibacteria group bacterium]MBU1963206.1 GAP family protein [Patescibacteria group bacterium]